MYGVWRVKILLIITFSPEKPPGLSLIMKFKFINYAIKFIKLKNCIILLITLAIHYNKLSVYTNFGIETKEW